MDERESRPIKPGEGRFNQFVGTLREQWERIMRGDLKGYPAPEPTRHEVAEVDWQAALERMYALMFAAREKERAGNPR